MEIEFPGGKQVLLPYPGQCQGFAEINLPSFWLCVSEGESLGDFLLAPVCPTGKASLWEDIFCLMPGFETKE